MCYSSYKITPRPQNAHAYVNGAFLFKLTPSYQVSERPAIVFGGISSTFNHASFAEDLLASGSISLGDETMFQSVLQAIEQEAVPEEEPVLASGSYRVHLAKALYYKVFFY